MAENTDTNKAKQMQLVQFIRNNVVLNSRKKAIQIVDQISEELNKSLKNQVKDGEPIIVRYKNENDVIITYMAVVALKNDGTYVLSHVINDMDENSIRTITDSSITTAISGLSGTIDSRIEQTFSSITSTVDDNTNNLSTKINQTASGLSVVSESVSGISRQMQDWSSIIEDVQGKVSSATIWYYKGRDDKKPTPPSTAATEETLMDFGWADNMDNMAAGEVWWTFTRYVYSNGNVVDTPISKMFVPKDGTTYYTWIKYSSAGTNSTTVSDDPLDGNGNMYPYIGFAECQTTKQESDNPKDYHWSLIKGQDGVSGKSGYMWIAYADKLDAKDGDKAYPSSAYQQPTDSTIYIGILPNQDDAKEKINKDDEKGKSWNARYSWSKFKGDDGVTYTTYIWVKYADSANPSDDAISDSNTKADGTYYSYIGYAYNKLKPENEDDNSKKASEYIWSPYAGNENIYTLVPLEANGLSALVKADDQLHVKIHCAIVKKGSTTVDKVTDKTFCIKITDDKGKYNSAVTVSDGEINLTYDDYQVKYSSLDDNNQVNLLSVYLLADETTAFENAYDVKLISVGYSGGYFRKATQDYVEQNVSDPSGDIAKLYQSSSALSASIKDVSGNVSTLSATTQGLVGNIKGISGNVNTLSVTSQGLADNIKDISDNVNTLSATSKGLEGRIADNKGNISQLSATSKGIESMVSNMKTSTGKNLFNFYSSQFGENVIPFIQGYGVGLNYSSSVKAYRISNLGFENQTGDYTVSFDVYCWGGTKLNVNLCNVQANGYNGDSTITVPTGKYTHYDFRFTIPESNTYVSPTSYNGFLDFENFDKNMLIKNLNITRGTIFSDAAYSQKDIDDIGRGSKYTDWAISSASPTTEMIDGMNRTVYVDLCAKTSGVTDVIYMNGITLKQDRSYTLSFYAKGSTTETLMVYLHPNSSNGNFNDVEYPAVAGATSKNLRSDGATSYIIDTTWRRFIIHFYNQSSDKLNCICARVPENTDNFVLYVADPVLEEGFITDTFDTTKSLIRQSADEILEQVGDTYIKIGDGNITLNGSTQVNGTLTLNDSTQGLLLVNGHNVCQISPKSLPSYASFSNAASISRSYSVNNYEVDCSQNASYSSFNYHFSDSIGNNFKVGDTISFGSLYHSMMTGRFGGGRTISNSVITFKVINANNVLFSVNKSSETNIDIPDQTVKYDGNVSITVDISATVVTNLYYGSNYPSSAIPKAYVNWSLNVTTPTRNTYLQISPDGMAVNFGTNKNVYIGNDGFYANFGNYHFSITSDGIVGNNVHRVKVYTASQKIPDDVDCAIFTGDGSLTATLPDSPYEGRTIKIFDKCQNLYLVSAKPVIQQNSKTGSALTGRQHELPKAFCWEYIYSNGNWYEMVLG